MSLQDKDRIFTNLYGFQDWGLKAAQQRGDWDDTKALIARGHDSIIDEMKASGLRGRGGAGFPTGLKWSFMPKESKDGRPSFLVINADESEPGSCKDREIIRHDPHKLIEGALVAGYAMRARAAYIYIRGEYIREAETLQAAVDEAYSAGLIGRNASKSGYDFDVFLHRGAGAYICGEETGLLESLEGKRGWPRIKPPFPAIKGLFGRPTIINNVETMAHLPSIIERGADWFKTMGTPGAGGPPSFGTKLMGVSGHVNRPGVYEFDLGIPLSTLVNEHCQGMRDGKKFKGAIAGGVSTGVLGPDQFDAPMDFDIGKNYNVLGLGTACPTIFDEDTDMVAVARNIARFFKHEACGQCTPCREGSGWLYQLLSRIEEGDARTKDLDLALEVATSMGSMPGTTICGLADGNNWATRTIMNKYRSEFEARVRPSHVAVKMTVGAATGD